MSVSGIQGQLLELTVVGCTNLRDTEWFSRQDPYVRLEYASNKFRTQTCTDGGRNPTFQEKFTFPLIEGLREINVDVWNSNNVRMDDFISSGKIQLQKVLSEGYDDSSWSLQTRSGKSSGLIRVIMHYQNANKPSKSSNPSTAHTQKDKDDPSKYQMPPWYPPGGYCFPPTPPVWPHPQIPQYPPVTQNYGYPPQQPPYPYPTYPGQYPRPYP